MVYKNAKSQFLQSFSAEARRTLLNSLAKKAYRFGEFTLASGRPSNHYVNCKPVSLSGDGLALLSIALLEQVDLEASAIAGLTLGADPLVSGVALTAALLNRPLDAIIVRKKAKGHGTGQWLEGPLPPKGSLITVLEDVVTSGGSSLQAVKQLRNAEYQVNTVVTIVDRQEGGLLAMEQEGIKLISLFNLDEIVKIYSSFSS
tara:strand:+ start:148 stop:753 length:606 start_codon:yes stop_codon:yes gene_type:complete